MWCFQGTSQLFTPSVNALIKSVILQERGGSPTFTHEGLTLQYKLDNEFELIFVVAYQKILQLSYIDKFLDDVHLEFRDKYKDELQHGNIFQNFDFERIFLKTLHSAEEWGKKQEVATKKMRSFEQSQKSKKTVASMIEHRKDLKVKENKKSEPKPEIKSNIAVNGTENGTEQELDDETIEKNRMKLFKLQQGKSKKTSDKGKSPQGQKQKGKEARIWENGGSVKGQAVLDFSKKGEHTSVEPGNDDPTTVESRSWIATMKGDLRGMDPESSSEGEEDGEEIEVDVNKSTNSKPKSRALGMFSMFRGLVGSKNITREDMVPVLEKMKEHLIAKNVAAEIAEKLCDSVATKLEGKVLGTFTGVASTVKVTLNEALVQLLSPHCRIDILRDVLEAQRQRRPYVMTFCGVNGVGKSTNLAKICFWLIENNLRVLIAACDTFRAGAVEQLRTHTRHLNALHPPEQHNSVQMVQLYEKGYGKDAAGIAMEAINYARDTRIDVVLVDTAGRMQDNEPLMRALSKLIQVNQPDLVLFVGEALVGNEAVDQLVKFNQALADHSSQEKPHLIDGIVLTKFDTIDDKVGAAISMTYITGRPIVFVGTGQTYVDLKTLNAKAVVHALMK